MDAILFFEQRKNQTISVPLELHELLNARDWVKAFPYREDPPCFAISRDETGGAFSLTTNYYVGVDWLVKGQVPIHVLPKQNAEEIEIDYFGMLLESLAAPENLDHLKGLFHIEYEEPWIAINQEQDLLSPILIAQFLKLTQKIVRKGLKKSYYQVTNNLNSRVKGKILVGQQLKHNVARNRFASTYCSFQEYGINTRENQFLKLVLSFVSSYLCSDNKFFNKPQSREMMHMLRYSVPAFELVDDLALPHQPVLVKKNAFYREYEEAVRIGRCILKRFSYTISNASQHVQKTPPFWIDMSKLFELYVFGKLRNVLPGNSAVTYHDVHNKKETDILIQEPEYKCVIDCKYKPRYGETSINLEDKRQLAGYVRLKSVYTKLSVPLNQIVKGVIIYPDQSADETINKDDLFSEENKVDEYAEFYKLGIRLPEK